MSEVCCCVFQFVSLEIIYVFQYETKVLSSTSREY